jgi:hypothetical protein
MGSSLNDDLILIAMNPPNGHAAPCEYRISVDRPPTREWLGRDTTLHVLEFHTGNPADGINGISNEVLLAIVRDRLECYQKSKFACDKNGHALVQIIGAMSALAERSAERTSRGVEGTQTP